MTDTAMLAKMQRPVARELDAIWEEVNALGGTFGEHDDYGRGVSETVNRVLDIIDTHGGMDPLARKARGEG